MESEGSAGQPSLLVDMDGITGFLLTFKQACQCCKLAQLKKLAPIASNTSGNLSPAKMRIPGAFCSNLVSTKIILSMTVIFFSHLPLILWVYPSRCWKQFERVEMQSKKSAEIHDIQSRNISLLAECCTI